MSSEAGTGAGTAALPDAGSASTLSNVYGIVAAVALGAFLVSALLFAVTVPYHDWDAFAFGEWSRRIAEGGSVDPITAGSLGAARPLFYALQGAVWAVTGVSFAAGRSLSLLFAAILVVGVAVLVRDRAVTAPVRRLQVGLAVLCLLSVAPLAQQSVAGLSDVPAAAMVAVTAAAALSYRASVGAALGLAALAFAATLTKPTALAPLVGLGVWLLVDRSRPLVARVRWSVAPLACGLAAGLVYDGIIAFRLDQGLVAYLRTGTTEGLWAERAAAARVDALLRLDVLGAGLRLPLAFALAYGITRSSGAAHRRAARISLVVALVWGVAGPLIAGGSPFPSADLTFAFVGFGVLLGAVALSGDDLAPARERITALTLLGVPPLLVWLYSTAYSDRLAATAWPGLVSLIALCLTAGIRQLGRLGIASGLAPVPVLLVALWLSLAGLDGFHGPMWREFRSLGVDGVWDENRTMNIVLPGMQSALALAAPRLADGGRLSVSDPRFQFFIPGRVRTTTALHCDDVAGFAVFILQTSDESRQLAREAGGLSEPAQWAACRRPRLEELSDGSNGFAVFAVHRD